MLIAKREDIRRLEHIALHAGGGGFTDQQSKVRHSLRQRRIFAIGARAIRDAESKAILGQKRKRNRGEFPATVCGAVQMTVFTANVELLPTPRTIQVPGKSSFVKCPLPSAFPTHFIDNCPPDTERSIKSLSFAFPKSCPS